METKEAILQYQYAERIKSQLIIAFKLLEKLAILRGEKWSGGEKVIASYLEALLGEIKIAQNAGKLKHLLEAEDRINQAIGHLRLFEQPELYRDLREAISHITTLAQTAMEELEKKGLL